VSGDILAVDVGTTALKLAVFSPALERRFETARAYPANLYDQGKADIEPERWWAAFESACREAGDHLSEVSVLSMGVTTPGLTPMGEDGTPLAPAVLVIDGRSHHQAASIRATVGDDVFLAETCNLPVAGGSSLCSILWFKDERPEVWERTAVFGHTNTYMVKRLTGEWAIDPSTVSITGMYRTPEDDLSWHEPILEAAGISPERLPPLYRSHDVVGTVRDEVAAQLGLPEGTAVLCGANDAALAALSADLTQSGGISVVLGTVDLITICTDRPVSSPKFNLRCHAVPGLWITLFVLNAGSKAFEWFHRQFCRDLTEEQFYGEYMPSVLTGFLAGDDVAAAEAALPTYVPYLAGSRYHTERLTGSFDGLSLETTREDLLVSMVRGNAAYHGEHFSEVSSMISVAGRAAISGGGARIGGMIEARRRWMADLEYEYQDQSSLLGAALLGSYSQTGRLPGARG
jgi:xylulokinase